MKLNQPKLKGATFERQLSEELTYLTGDGRAPTLVFQCVAGGYLNPKYLEAMNAAELERKADVLRMEGIDDPDERAKALQDMLDGYGEKALRALYDHCVVEWATNIQSNGQDMTSDYDHFFALGESGVPGIADVYTGLAEFVDTLSNFRGEAVKEAEKN